MRRSLILLFCFAWSFRLFSAEAPLTNCLQVLSLSTAEAERSIPVRLKAAVTSYIPSVQLCFVQDETAGLYVQPSPWPADLTVGEIMTVEGFSAPGRFSPIVHFGTFQKTGSRTNIVAKPVSIEELNSGKFDCQLVQIEGVVQKITPAPGVWILDLHSGASSASFLLFGAAQQPANLVDARVRCRGVAGTFYGNDRLTGFGLFGSSAEQIEILKPAGNVFTAPLRPLGKLPWYSQEGAFDHRIRIQGVVTVSWTNNTFFVRDDTGSLSVSVTDKELPQAGDFVEVSGFIENIVQSPRMVGGVYRKLGTRPKPEPQVIKVRQLQSASSSGQYVMLEGRIAAIDLREGGLKEFTIDSGEGFFRAFTFEALTNFVSGAMVKLTGAWSRPPSELGKDISAGLWLGPAREQILLALPPVVSVAAAPPQIYRGWLAGIGIALAGLIAALAFSQRRQARLAAGHRVTQDQLATLRQEFQDQVEARERLGRDLHDHTIQSIYAIGLNLDDCTHLIRDDPAKVEPRLRTAMTEVNAVISELRNVILGLETNAIQPREFRTALKSLSLALGYEKSSHIRLDIEEQAIEALTPAQATELIHIAREAMSNSIRHGGAQTNSFALELSAQEVRFTISDDGCGFNVEKPERQGFGLRNMAKRAENLGAKFTVYSRKGSGTRIVLDIPRQKQHPTLK